MTGMLLALAMFLTVSVRLFGNRDERRTRKTQHRHHLRR